MKILCLSDTHGYLPSVESLDLTDVDLVLHAGDMTFEAKHNHTAQLNYFERKFCPWVEKIEDAGVGFFFTWGNHEMFAEKLPISYNEITRNHLLHDDGFNLIDKDENVIRIWGTAWQPEFCWWAFNCQDTPEDLGKRYARIPNDTDILLTHCPMVDVLDLTGNNERVGSLQLNLRIFQLKQLKLHVFGHIHHSYGEQKPNEEDNIHYVNASICNEAYKPVNKPILVEI